MVRALAEVDIRRDSFAAELTEATLDVTARHGVSGASVDWELELWVIVSERVRAERSWPNEGRGVDAWRGTFTADLVEAVYRAALRHGFRDPFVDLELNLWTTIRGVFRRRHFLEGFGVAQIRDDRPTIRRWKRYLDRLAPARG